MQMIEQLLSYSLIPIFASVVGAGVALQKPTSAKLRGMIQHFAAGVIFSVVSVELIPDVMKRHSPPYVIMGFVLGIVVMLWIKSATTQQEARESKTQKFPRAMLTAVSIDTLLDGFLLGIGFSAGNKEGLLLTAALTLELLSIGLALAFELRELGFLRSSILKIVAGVSSLVSVGTIIGALVLRHASDNLMELVLSFGLVALLFLVTEELLAEAHEEKETPITTAMFFIGFVIFLILGMI